jgi:hypothetical protein
MQQGVLADRRVTLQHWTWELHMVHHDAGVTMPHLVQSMRVPQCHIACSAIQHCKWGLSHNAASYMRALLSNTMYESCTVLRNDAAFTYMGGAMRASCTRMQNHT